MDVAQLLEPVLTGGIKDTNFFNGRILTADDLRTMRAAARQHDAQLGRAIGEGIVYGLDVSEAAGSAADKTQAVLHVTAGLGFNWFGEPAALPAATDIRLLRKPNPGSTDDGIFTVCVPPTASEFTNLGLYLFTVAPVSGLEGRVPMTELSFEGVGTKCGSRYEIEGVKFGLTPLRLPSGTPLRPDLNALFATMQSQVAALPPGRVSEEAFKLRNGVAHLCFGSDLLEQHLSSLWMGGTEGTPSASHGWLHELRDQKVLASCEIPLALLYWSTRGVEFVDQWAVRRRPSASARTQKPWQISEDARHTTVAEARLWQFQDEIEAIQSGLSNPSATVATHVFRYLPPAGLVPLTGLGGTAFDLLTFFSATTKRKPAIIEGARVSQILCESFMYPPIDTASKEHVWLYLIRENKFAIDNAQSEPRQLFVMFARGDMPYRGNAHFDVAHWDYSSYALGCGGLETIQLA